VANTNLVIELENGSPNYVDSTVRFARIDNTPAPVYTTVNNVATSPLVISNIPNGQYRVISKPNFSDGRNCPEQTQDTVPCTGITSLSAVFSDPDITVNYTCDPAVPSVRINVNYPNGGFSSTIVTNDGSPVNITPPAGVYGTYLVTIQPVCDVDSGFFGVASAPVSVDIPVPSP
jgi:hypothetical protein